MELTENNTDEIGAKDELNTEETDSGTLVINDDAPDKLTGNEDDNKALPETNGNTLGNKELTGTKDDDANGALEIEAELGTILEIETKGAKGAKAEELLNADKGPVIDKPREEGIDKDAGNEELKDLELSIAADGNKEPRIDDKGTKDTKGAAKGINEAI